MIRTLKDFINEEVGKKPVIEITFERRKALAYDAYGGGWVEASPKKFHFLEDKRKYKYAAEATISINGKVLFSNVGFWYINENSALQDFRNQMYLYIILASAMHHASSWRYYADELQKSFKNDFSEKISDAKCQDYADFLLTNNWFEAVNGIRDLHDVDEYMLFDDFSDNSTQIEEVDAEVIVKWK